MWGVERMLSDVSRIYYNKLKLLGIDDVAHSTRLKNKLLAHIQGLEARVSFKGGQGGAFAPPLPEYRTPL